MRFARWASAFAVTALTAALPAPVAAAATPHDPVGRLDAAYSTATRQIQVRGWGYDPDAPQANIAVDVYIDGHGTRQHTGRWRPDVARTHPGVWRFTGFSFTSAVLAYGSHRVCTYLINRGPGANTGLGCRTVTVVERHNPVGRLDAAVGTTGLQIVVRGWGYDPDSPQANIAVDVYIDGHGTRLHTGRWRPDVARTYPGVWSYTGFTYTSGLLAGGQHRVCTYLINRGPGANTGLGCRTVMLGDPAASIVLDAIGDGGPDTAHWTAGLAARIRADRPSLLLWAGDVRNTGTPAEWQLYDQNYGSLKSVTLPTPGNHDWGNRTVGYDVEYAGDPYADTTDYCNAVTLANGWQLYSINTYTRSACMNALTAFLSSPGTRKIVLTHEPRWSGGAHASAAQDPIWQAMRGHAIALVAGHDHDSQVIERDGLVQLVSGCAGATYYAVTPIAGTVYYSTSVADCTYDRLTLGPNTMTVQAVHADGSIDFAKTYTVAP